MICLSYNIQYGFGRDGRYDLSRTLAVMQDADLIALQEVDRHWSRTGFDDQPARIMAALPDHYAVYGPAFDMDASTVEGGRVLNRRRQFGPMVLSRWPIRWSRLHLLPLCRMIDPINTQTGALEAMIDTPLGPLRFWSLHLAHVGVEERLAQIDRILAHEAALPRIGGPWSGRDDEPDRAWTEGEGEPPCPPTAILMGDFNAVPGSVELARLTGEMPWHPGALYAGAWVDAVARTGARLHTHEKRIAGLDTLRQLDHCFVTADLAPRIRRAWTNPAATASDHFPLWVELE
jgi:endonuclease/exonuclease/phosphatase family metal-dependent hydrolase